MGFAHKVLVDHLFASLWITLCLQIWSFDAENVNVCWVSRPYQLTLSCRTLRMDSSFLLEFPGCVLLSQDCQSRPPPAPCLCPCRGSTAFCQMSRTPASRPWLSSAWIVSWGSAASCWLLRRNGRMGESCGRPHCPVSVTVQSHWNGETTGILDVVARCYRLVDRRCLFGRRELRRTAQTTAVGPARASPSTNSTCYLDAARNDTV